MDRLKAKLLRRILEEVFEVNKDLFTENQFSVEVGNISFTNISSVVKLKVTDIKDDGEIISVIAENFKKYAVDYGFSLTDLGRVFKNMGKDFKIIGFNPRARKNHIILDCEGVSYRATAKHVLFRLKS